jgi:hypothetical protein
MTDYSAPRWFPVNPATAGTRNKRGLQLASALPGRRGGDSPGLTLLPVAKKLASGWQQQLVLLLEHRSQPAGEKKSPQCCWQLAIGLQRVHDVDKTAHVDFK